MFRNNRKKGESDDIVLDLSEIDINKPKYNLSELKDNLQHVKDIYIDSNDESDFDDISENNINKPKYNLSELKDHLQHVKDLYTANDSDSDSDDDTEYILKDIAKDDIVWFERFGFKLSINSSLVFTQISIGIIMIFFCLYKLIKNDNCETTSVYAPLLTAIIGYFLPNPKVGDKKTKH